MKISKFKNALKVCDIQLDGKGKCLWSINWSNKSKKYLTKEIGRCYFIVVNNDIVKIGFSDCKGGIKGTIDAGYKSAGNGGSPSIRTHGIHVLIAEELLKGNVVNFYCQYNNVIKVPVELGDGSIKIEKTSLSGKILEEGNRNIFKLKENNKLPIWNFQESYTPWPKYIQESLFELKSIKKSVTIEDINNRLLPFIRKRKLKSLSIS
jgi:hypothetical protein